MQVERSCITAEKLIFLYVKGELFFFSCFMYTKKKEMGLSQVHLLYQSNTISKQYFLP
ncbi:hypothetical protein HMPREF0648_0709 [Prevotella bivia JCVIHMP010]|nr:hypothetical protein HMPREF0648_0709 [Prevotella bivia JCVIHMP010]KXU59703.1 hypothetical protein HMPREF3218_0200533 [Prevotella bivia]